MQTHYDGHIRDIRELLGKKLSCNGGSFSKRLCPLCLEDDSLAAHRRLEQQ